ncbi:Wzz/FepE/Etk N-terminal domain-containing protein [uncultured Abyssibacter sp.]|uniref:GumC family protein n=1 Tax=uncultured Abyssibacter sp. TaxID=2320202 RepID=UPI0032B1ECA6
MSQASTSAPAAIPDSLQPAVISIPQLTAMLLARWKLIVILGLGCALVAAVLSKLVLPKSYTAIATVMVDFEVNDPLSRREFPVHLTASYMATQMEFIRSPEVLGAAIDELGWASDPERLAGLPGQDTPEHRQAWLRTQMAESLSIRQGDESRFIYISFTAETAEDAARGANTVARSYVQAQQAKQQGPARERAIQVEKKLETLRERVDKAEQQVAKFRDSSGLIELDSDNRDQQQQLVDLERRLSEARVRRREAQQRLNYAINSNTAVLGSQLIQEMKRQVSTLEARLADLSTTLGPRHPDYIALNNELSAARHRLSIELDNYVNNARAELSAARAQERGLETERDNLKAGLRSDQSTKEAGAQYLRELNTAKQLYAQALNEYDTVLLGAGTEYSNASLASPAQPPLRPTGPKAKVNTIAGGLLGGFLGLALALLLEFSRRRVRCRADVERELNLPVLGDLTRKTSGWPPNLNFLSRRPS